MYTPSCVGAAGHILPLHHARRSVWLLCLYTLRFADACHLARNLFHMHCIIICFRSNDRQQQQQTAAAGGNGDPASRDRDAAASDQPALDSGSDGGTAGFAPEVHSPLPTLPADWQTVYANVERLVV